MQPCGLVRNKCARPFTLRIAPCIARRAVNRRLPPFQCRSYASVSAAKLSFGQPVHETHPHLLKPGECEIWHTDFAKASLIATVSAVTPGITALEYAQRRSKLASKLPKNAIAIIASSDVKYRSGAVFYEFHQDSNFFYLTGMAHVCQCWSIHTEEYRI